ncbi:MAG: hypothetical protein ACP5K1_01180 [Candidatus Bathyarchaeia archaeon]
MRDKAPELVEEFVDKAPPEVIGSFMKFIVRIVSLFSKMEGKRLEEIPAEEKIKLSKEMDKIISDARELLERWKE